jgi:transcriptional regulator with XRE-family HTH domain
MQVQSHKIKFGRSVFKKRREEGISIQTISDRTGISTKLLTRIEKGYPSLTFDMYRSIRRAFDSHLEIS